MNLEKNFRLKYKEVPTYWDGNCFGCSKTNPEGLKLPIFVSESGCHSYTSISENLCGFEGLVHGGIIATLLDEIAAWSIISHIYTVGVTKEAKINYLKPVKTNTPIILESKIISKNEAKVITKSMIKNLNDEILAECESKWFLPNFETIGHIIGKKTSEIEELINKTVEPLKKIFKKN